jgi:hypothetical protein
MLGALVVVDVLVAVSMIAFGLALLTRSTMLREERRARLADALDRTRAIDIERADSRAPMPMTGGVRDARVHH